MSNHDVHEEHRSP